MMKLIVSRNKLNAALAKVNSVVSARSTLQILGNILMEAEGNALRLTTTDLDVRISAEVEAKVEVAGVTTIPAKTFQSVIRSMVGDSVTLDSNDSHHMKILCGNSNFKLLGLSPEDFPLPLEMTPVRRFKLSQADLARMITMISYAVNQEDTRKALNGILFSLNENNFVTVATDGRRLALVEKIVEDSSGADGDCIIPVRAAQELCKLLEKTGSVEVEIGDNMGRFSLDNATVMTTKLIDESYPNYRQVIPASFSRKLELPRESVVDTLRRVSLVVSERSFYVQLKFADNKIDFQANSSDVGEGSDFVPIAYNDTEIVISFNPVFMIEPMERLDSDTVSMKMNDGYSPVALCTDDGFLYVIMPMRNNR